MKQAINTALTAYIAAARAFTSASEFSEVFAAMYADDADCVEEALREYNASDDLAALQDAIEELDDEGSEQVFAYCEKHGYTDALAALKKM